MFTTDITTLCFFIPEKGLVQNRATCTPTEPQPGFNQAIISDLTSDPSDCTILSNMLLPKKTKSNTSAPYIGEVSLQLSAVFLYLNIDDNASFLTLDCYGGVNLK